jgi:hypothetical protein
MAALARALQARGRLVDVVALPEHGADDVDRSASALGNVIDRAAGDVDLVGYSLGGLVIRRWYGRAAPAERVRVRLVVSLATPFGGIELPPHPEWTGTRRCDDRVACGQVAPGAAYLAAVTAAPRPPRWVALHSRYDRLVRPERIALLGGDADLAVQDACPGARLGHLALREAPLVVAFVSAVLDGVRPTQALRASCDAPSPSPTPSWRGGGEPAHGSVRDRADERA